LKLQDMGIRDEIAQMMEDGNARNVMAYISFASLMILKLKE